MSGDIHRAEFLASRERLQPGDGAAQDQRVHVMGAFVGVDRLEVRGVPHEDLARQTTENFFRLFNKTFERTTNGYTRVVGGTLRRAGIALAVYAGLLLLAWGGFSVAATLAQWALEKATLLSPMDMAANSRVLGGLLFIAAGLYQFTPVKLACLRSCRSYDWPLRLLDRF